MLLFWWRHPIRPTNSPSRWVARALFLACLGTSAGCGKPNVRAVDETFDCRGPKSQALALAHLKEADLTLLGPDARDAMYTTVLTSRGLACAPPRGHALPWTVGRLLLVRARASARLDSASDALLDLEAAVQWVRGRARREDPPLLPEIHLETARAHLRLLHHPKALDSLNDALMAARDLGSETAALQCEALLLQGDVRTRLDPHDDRAGTSYRRVFHVAERYDYPEETWDYLEGAIARLPQLSSSEKSKLLGPVPELRAAKQADEEEVRALSGGGTRPTENMMRITSGRVPQADQTVASMRSGFRRCFQKSLIAGNSPGGRAVLTISIDAGGAVENVEARSEKMDRATIDCLADEARRAQFNPPETNHAILEVPVMLVQQ